MERCAFNNTLIGAIATANYARPLHKLADSAVPHGFACVVTQPNDAAHAHKLSQRHVHLLDPPATPLLPRKQWCNSSLHGWRLTHLLKMRLWRVVLLAGFDLLSLDANFYMAFNPVPAIHSIAWKPVAPDGHLAPVDVVGVHDGAANKLLNIGLMWVRSTEATRALVSRAENRTWGSWDQMVFNDELNSNVLFKSVGCCHTPYIKRAAPPQPGGDAAIHSATLRAKLEGADRCVSSDEDIPLAAPPPRGSRHYHIETWSPTKYNELPSLKSRRFQRCTSFTGKPDECCDACCCGIYSDHRNRTR
ncbi:hypothetical protein AB1Y20_014057 [Prymnesium parvum]|uniref:Nucleotide-diphospho-sugar transferase domain-containing protein n=1 Tax=Prymnesium parvum TaxID=97485 RepID=A0AB34IHS4_PRYPA